MLLPKNYNEKLINGFAGYEIKDLKSPEAVVPVSVLLQSLAEQQKTMAEQQADESLDCWKAAEGLHKNGLAVMGEALNKQHQTSLEQWRSMLMPMMLFMLVLGIIIGGLVTYVLMRPNSVPVVSQQSVTQLQSQIALLNAEAPLRQYDSSSIGKLNNYTVPRGQYILIIGYDIHVVVSKGQNHSVHNVPGYGMLVINAGNTIQEPSYRSYPLNGSNFEFTGAGMQTSAIAVRDLVKEVKAHKGEVVQL